MDKVQDLVVEVGVGSEADFPTSVIVAIQVVWLRLIVVVMVGDGETVVAEDDVAVGHGEDDDGDR